MLGNYLIPNGVEIRSGVCNKWQVLESLARLYCAGIQSQVADQILETILLRELKVSTGLGGGVAIPHARTDLVDRTGLLFVRFNDGIEWNSMDGALVYFLFLVIGPNSSAEEYLHVLSKISKVLSRKETRSSLMHAKSGKEIVRIMTSVKNRVLPR